MEWGFTMIRLGCSADLQLDTKRLTAGALDLDAATGINRRLLNTARCWAAFCEQAKELHTDLNVCAGDIFERPRPTPLEMKLLFEPLDAMFADPLAAPMIMCDGNHDLPFSLVEESALVALRDRYRKLHVHHQPALYRIPVQGTELQVAVLPFPRRAGISLKEANRDLSPQAITDRIARGVEIILDGFRAELDPTLPSVLVTHLTVGESRISEAQPSVPMEMGAIPQHVFRGFTLTVAGHIHARQEFIGEDYHILVPGSMDRVDVSEEREDKSWSLVTLAQVGGRWTVSSVEPQPLPARIFCTLTPSDVRLLDLDEANLSRLLADQPILRVKGHVTPTEAEEILKITGSWRVPVANALEVERETRARDATMTGDLSPERALRAHLEKSGDPQEEIDALLALHGDIAGQER